MTEETVAPVPEIHIHEDEWGMRRLHPLMAAEEVTDGVHAAVAASDANRGPDGAGWTSLHIIRPAQYGYAEAGLSFAQASSVLAPILPRVRRFTATAMAGFEEGAHDPFGSYEDHAHCYGLDASCLIKLDGDGVLVQEIWFTADTRDARHLENLRQAIVALDQLVPSVIADYWLGCTGAVRDSEFLDNYMSSLSAPDET